MQQIIFFSKDDLASYQMMNNINEFLIKNPEEKTTYTINEILQLHHICEYLDNGFTHEDWDDRKTEYNRKQIKDFKRIINLYFNRLTCIEILKFYDEIDYNYYESFWLLINRFEIYKKIEPENFKLLFQKNNFNINDVLYCNRVVIFFEQEVRDFLLSKAKNIEILLEYYESSHDRKPKEKFFPKSLTLNDREKLIGDYLDSEDTNLNYIRLIEKNKDSEFLKVNDKLRLKAKRLSIKQNQEHFNDDNTIVVKRGVSIDKDQEEISKIIYEHDRQIISYGEKRLLEKTDNVTLFRNFRTVFGLIDFQGCIDLVLKSAQIDTIEKVLMRSKNEFIVSAQFRDTTLIGELKFKIYQHFLESINLSVENLLENFVTNHLNSKFSVNSFKLHLPTPSSKPLEKIRLIVPEFESLIEQYKLYVDDDFIDFELLQVTTKTSGFEKIPSLLEKKYVYPAGDEYLKLNHNFFNNMSYLFEYSKYGKKYNCFYQLITSENITVEDFEVNRRPYVEQFIDEQHLKIDENGWIKPSNRDLLYVIDILAKNDVLSYWYFPQQIRNEIDKMGERKMVTFSGSLFNKSEQNFFNFYLNNRYSNGLWLRNKYVHATNTHDEEEQKYDYDILLKLLVILVLKIEDDLTIANSLIIADMNNKNKPMI